MILKPVFLSFSLSLCFMWTLINKVFYESGDTNMRKTAIICIINILDGYVKQEERERAAVDDAKIGPLWQLFSVSNRFFVNQDFCLISLLSPLIPLVFFSCRLSRVCSLSFLSTIPHHLSSLLMVGFFFVYWNPNIANIKFSDKTIRPRKT